MSRRSAFEPPRGCRRSLDLPGRRFIRASLVRVRSCAALHSRLASVSGAGSLRWGTMGIGSFRAQAFAAVAGMVAAIGVFVGSWLGLIGAGEALFGYPPTQFGHSPRFTDVVLPYVGVSIAVIAAVNLPFALLTMRNMIAADHQAGDSKAFVGSEGHLLGAMTRWRLRVGVLIAFFAVTLGLSLVVLIAGVDFSALFRMIGSLVKSSKERRSVMETQSRLVFRGLDGSALDWALLSGAILWMAAKIRNVFEVGALPVGRYRYPERSVRFLRSVAVGVRRGLSAAALTVIALPAVLLDYELALRLSVVAEWSKEWPLQLVSGRLDRLVTMIAVDPVKGALLFEIIPLSIIIIVHRSLRRFVALDSQEWALSDDMRPSLYLRSWAADQIRVPAPALRRGAVEHFAPPRRMSFAELIAESAEWRAPVLAVRQPKAGRLSGVGSIWLPDDRWHDAVRAHAADALCVVMTAGADLTASYAWELDLLGAGTLTSRLMIVFPPGLTVTQSRAPGGFLATAEQLPVFRDLATMGLSDETIVLARSGERAWKAYTARVRTDGAYCLCILEAFDHFTPDWDRELNKLRAPSRYPSVERFVRDEGMLGYREAIVARWVARGFLLFEKMRGGRSAGE
jgi:hypothetical protein